MHQTTTKYLISAPKDIAAKRAKRRGNYLIAFTFALFLLLLIYRWPVMVRASWF